MDFTQLLMAVVTGGIGGNIAGALFKQFSLGMAGNTIAGMLGGGIGGQILGSLLGGGAPAGFGGNVAGAGVGGLLVTIVVGLVKNMLAGKR